MVPAGYERYTEASFSPICPELLLDELVKKQLEFIVLIDVVKCLEPSPCFPARLPGFSLLNGAPSLEFAALGMA